MKILLASSLSNFFSKWRQKAGTVKSRPDPVMANASMDRLAHQAYHIALTTDESFRKKMRPTMNKES